MHKHRGFTLFELVVSLSIIAIMIAVALHYFSDMPREARISKLQSAYANVVAASNLVHNAYLLRKNQADVSPCANTGKIANNHSTICSENGLVAIVNGYPQALPPGQGAGIIAISGLHSRFNASATELLEAGFSFAGGGPKRNSQLWIQLHNSPDPSRCRFSYQPASSPQGGPAVIETPLTEGC